MTRLEYLLEKERVAGLDKAEKYELQERKGDSMGKKKSPLHEPLKCENSKPCIDCEQTYQDMTDDELTALSEKLKDYFTPNGNHWEELTTMLEVEREITLRED